MLRSVYFLLVMAFLHSSAFSSDIIINEIGASSFKNYFDEDHDDSDWIELYNQSENPINLKDYKIYDKNKVDKAWVFPDTIIQPKGFLRIFASDKDRTSSNNYFVQASSNTNLVHTLKDEGRFQYEQVTGNFEISVKIKSLISEYYWSVAGLTIRENLRNNAKSTSLLSTPIINQAMSLAFRTEEGDTSYRIDYSEIDFPYVWYKFKRVSDTIFYYLKKDGYTWTLIHQQKFDFRDTLYIGIITSLGNLNNDFYKGVFYSDLEINNKLIDFSNLKIIDYGKGMVSNNISFYSKELHTNFKLSKSGEILYLWDNEGSLIDKFTFDKQYTNVSYGRYPDGSENFGFLNKITPEFPNVMNYYGVNSPVLISHNSDWYDAPISVTLSSENNKDSIYYTLDGKDPNINSQLYNGQPIYIEKNT